MGYHHVVVDDLDPAPDRPSVQRAIGDAAGLESLAVNRYEVAPGEQVPLAYHYHDRQEEVFYVLSGTLAVETPEGTYEVGADEALAVDPESPQRAHNPGDADERVVVLAAGAPAVEDAHAYDPDNDHEH
ncbi:MAG: cupin domain-containing protein [Haloarculaceae archaeon]